MCLVGVCCGSLISRLITDPPIRGALISRLITDPPIRATLTLFPNGLAQIHGSSALYGCREKFG